MCDYGSFHPMIARKGKYITGNVYSKIKKIFTKFGYIRVCWDLIKAKTFLIWVIMRYQRERSNMIYVQQKCGMICLKKPIEGTTCSSVDPEQN